MQHIRDVLITVFGAYLGVAGSKLYDLFPQSFCFASTYIIVSLLAVSSVALTHRLMSINIGELIIGAFRAIALVTIVFLLFSIYILAVIYLDKSSCMFLILKYYFPIALLVLFGVAVSVIQTIQTRHQPQ